MKQKLLTDIELDVHELNYLMDSFTKEPTLTLSELLKRSITRMQGRLDELQQEVDAVQLTSTSAVEETVEDTNEVAESEVDSPVIIQSLESVVVKEEGEKEEPAIVEEPVVETVVKEEELKSAVLGESLKLSAGLRHAISLNDSFRFSRELFGGDTDLMNRVIEQISVMSSYKTAVAFLSSKVEINEEKEAVNDFLELLKKYFNQSA
ncbi:hypothetical protein FNW54_05995 [Bacteroides sp. HF-5092]|uniref:hypothetical protein n=1 Tax=Bacteroides TaxID=816 RepID=UPI0011785A30|nr:MULTISPECIES: hypothetical protein [Bacteroides]TRX45899.1 hypothetical protein FNW54_05995 [Bacteroides sp. HF-5092]